MWTLRPQRPSAARMAKSGFASPKTAVLPQPERLAVSSACKLFGDVARDDGMQVFRAISDRPHFEFFLRRLVALHDVNLDRHAQSAELANHLLSRLIPIHQHANAARYLSDIPQKQTLQRAK